MLHAQTSQSNYQRWLVQLVRSATFAFVHFFLSFFPLAYQSLLHHQVSFTDLKVLCNVNANPTLSMCTIPGDLSAVGSILTNGAAIVVQFPWVALLGLGLQCTVISSSLVM